MRTLVITTALVVGGLTLWVLADQLSSDAIGMMLGIFFGMLAALPAALLVMAAGRSHSAERAPVRAHAEPPLHGYAQYPQMPIIVLGSQNPQPSAPLLLPPPGGAELTAYPVGQAGNTRRFRVVGETEESIDEW